MISSWLVVLNKNTKKVLILKRSDSSNNRGKWDFPGGSTKGLKSHRKLIYKETLQEIGIRPTKLSFIYSVRRKNKKYHYYMYFVKEDILPTLSHEHSDFKWVKIYKLKYLKKLHLSVKVFINLFYNHN